MKLGTATGSLINHVLSGASATPKIGDGATILKWTDRKAATVIEVSDGGKRVVVSVDIARRTDNRGQSEAQEYEYETDPNGAIATFTRRKNGSYIESGTKNGDRLAIGCRREYHDYSF